MASFPDARPVVWTRPLPARVLAALSYSDRFDDERSPLFVLSSRPKTVDGVDDRPILEMPAVSGRLASLGRNVEVDRTATDLDPAHAPDESGTRSDIFVNSKMAREEKSSIYRPIATKNTTIN